MADAGKVLTLGVLMLAAPLGLAGALDPPPIPPAPQGPVCTPPLAAGPAVVSSVCTPEVAAPQVDFPLLVDESGDEMTGDLRVAGQVRYGVAQELTGASSVAFGGLDGDRDRIYEILGHGKLSDVAGAERFVTLRPNGDDGAGGTQIYFGHGGFHIGGFSSGGGFDGSGGHLRLAASCFSSNSDISFQALFFAAAGLRRSEHGSHVCSPPGLSARVAFSEHSGIWFNTADKVESLVVYFGGASFTGTVVLRAAAP